MSWLFSQALVEEYLGASSLDGEQSAPLSGKPTPQAYCSPDKMTAFSRLSRFGMTFAPLTDIHGEELSMSSVVDFHVKTFQRQEKAQVLMESEVECGEKWRGSFVKYDPDLSLWRTHQCSLLGDLEPYLETWPHWGLMRNGECWEQQTLERRIRGTESGSELSKWATPTTMDKLPPKSAQALHKEATQARPNRSKPANLRDQVSNMHMWPTPVHSEARQGLQIRRAGKKGTQTSLSTAVLTWPTPRTKGMCGGSGSWDLLNKNTTIEEARLMGAGNGGQLNPTWVEKLMGWPTDWTCINNISHIKMMFWIMGFYDDRERCTNQILQMLRQGNVSKEIQQQIGRPVDILEAAVLLTQLCEYSNRPDEARIFFSCQEVLEKEMRSLRLQQETSGSSHRSGHQEQLREQHSDTMQALSRLLAHHGKKAWKNNSWEDGIPRVGRDIIARVDRLKAIGNGQVPLCAATAWKILSE